MVKNAAAERGVNPIDRHVGLRIRIRRKELGVSQERLAESIGLTFQQVQKYERAANRISASKLWEVAQALSTTVAYFYEGLGDGSSDSAGTAHRDATNTFLLSSDGMELATTFPKLRTGRMRRKIMELVKLIADEEHT
ncbi:MAG: helix-turn-helix transcriptional regulator [Phenylobacterium sp.]